MILGYELLEKFKPALRILGFLCVCALAIVLAAGVAAIIVKIRNKINKNK